MKTGGDNPPSQPLRHSQLASLIALVIVSVYGIGTSISLWVQTQTVGSACIGLQACPSNLTGQIVSLERSELSFIILTLAAIVSFASLTHALSRGPRKLAPSIDTDSMTVESLTDSLVAKCLEAQTLQFEGISTRAAVLLGFVFTATTIIGSGLFQVPAGSTAWDETAVLFMLFSAAFLLLCLLRRWGSGFDSLPFLVPSTSDGRGQLEGVRQGMLASITLNVTSLAWIRASFYTGVGLWGIGLIAATVAWTVR